MKKYTLSALVVLVALLALGGWLWYGKHKENQLNQSKNGIIGSQDSTQATTTVPQTQMPPEVTKEESMAQSLDVSTWKTYQNDIIGIKFQYPGNYSVSSMDYFEFLRTTVSPLPESPLSNLDNNKFDIVLVPLRKNESLQAARNLYLDRIGIQYDRHIPAQTTTRGKIITQTFSDVPAVQVHGSESSLVPARVNMIFVKNSFIAHILYFPGSEKSMNVFMENLLQKVSSSIVEIPKR